jgi:peptidoglycan hydrolase CwlO-like protein
MSALLRTRVTAVGALLALALAAGSVPALAQSYSDLSAAQKKVNALEAKIEREQASVRALQSELRTLSATVGAEQASLDGVRSELARTTGAIKDTKAHLQTLRDQIKLRARTAYKQGPLQLFSILIGAQTMGQFIERTAYASRIAKRDARVVLEARKTESKLRDIQTQQASLEREQATKVGTLRSRQEALTDTFARQQVVLAELAHSRAEAIQLVATLASKLGSGLAGLRRVAGQGMTISYGEWATAFLVAIGAPTSRANLVATVAWEAAEGTDATWNPLATTYDMPGATRYNSSGVRNYVSKGQGIEATVSTLKLSGHGYEAILASLRRGAPAMESAKAINASDWCRGCAGGTYVTGYVPAVERYYDRYAG